MGMKVNRVYSSRKENEISLEERLNAPDRVRIIPSHTTFDLHHSLKAYLKVISSSSLHTDHKALSKLANTNYFTLID